jgi:hypothetical protein
MPYQDKLFHGQDDGDGIVFCVSNDLTSTDYLDFAFHLPLSGRFLNFTAGTCVVRQVAERGSALGDIKGPVWTPPVVGR